MNILIVRTKKGVKYAQKIQDYINYRKLNCYVATIREIKDFMKKYKLKPINTLIYSRTAGRITNMKLAEIEKTGFKVINSPKTLELTSNKYKANIHAAKNNISTAKTYKIKKDDLSLIKDLLKKHKIMVLKPIYSQGQGIYCQKIEVGLLEQELRNKINIVPGKKILAQEFIDYQKLIRAIVIDYEALKNAYTYDTPNQNWKCSVCLNPNIKKYEPGDDKLEKLAEKTARTFQTKVNFIDFFEDKKGNFILNELNTACSLFFHEKITGAPIHKYIGNFLIKEAGKINE